MKPFETKSSRVVWSCPWYNVRQDEIVLPDGRPGVYNVVQKPDAVFVVPVTAEGEVVLVYQYRYTVNDWCWEVPAGAQQPGLSLEETARVELREEVGGTAEDLEYLGHFYAANGICNEVSHLYLATGVRLAETAHEAAEVMTVHRFAAAEVVRMARAGEVRDGASALALLRCAERLVGVK
jgi:8-oxo-dGTP pyrophosphatase MutT (NUDIX family)